jgi:hypothetical protein
VDRQLLGIYLNDHLAGSTAAVELVRRAGAANRGTDFEAAFERLGREIEEDRDALIDVLARLGIRRDPLKLWAGWLAEKGGRLKRNGRLTGYSPLSRVLELEVLGLGVEGKRAMWRTLDRLAAEEPRLDGVDLSELLRRANGQRRLIEQQRQRAARLAFSDEG